MGSSADNLCSFNIRFLKDLGYHFRDPYNKDPIIRIIAHWGLYGVTLFMETIRHFWPMLACYPSRKGSVKH